MACSAAVPQCAEALNLCASHCAARGLGRSASPAAHAPAALLIPRAMLRVVIRVPAERENHRKRLRVDATDKAFFFFPRPRPHVRQYCNVQGKLLSPGRRAVPSPAAFSLKGKTSRVFSRVLARLCHSVSLQSFQKDSSATSNYPRQYNTPPPPPPQKKKLSEKLSTFKMQIKTSLLLSALLGLGMAKDVVSTSSLPTGTATALALSSASSSASTTFSRASNSTTLIRSVFSNSTITTRYSNSTTTSSTPATISVGPTTTPALPPTTTSAAATTTRSSGAGRSDFGVAILGLAMAANLAI
ncbi:hypothetical protein B0T26DRAFT_447785 [Lasiosphaeria miniovina]|uniref:Uncharacterized protein n=1 Tax=Lasiosphaeria miniovina TaxID=1954250 RepID=A0AA39ZZ57_9PEZI|nr:uncharacterized protein B0T26DRAFT_447785 [Lasiosphaeria miniovina]KAK0706337.1 hypothetical protein B0T26DRAFT_447785 [Lasiosphaeria miniovina]